MLVIQRPTVEALGDDHPARQRFAVGPLEPGFGHTIGNSLRRCLLSSIPGAAITAVRFDDALHEFDTIHGVSEDVTDVILNIKDMIVSMEGEEPKTMRLQAEGPGEVTCELIEADTSITIHNKDLVLATLTKEVDFDMEFAVKKGRGYLPASEQYQERGDQERRDSGLHLRSRRRKARAARASRPPT